MADLKIMLKNFRIYHDTILKEMMYVYKNSPEDHNCIRTKKFDKQFVEIPNRWVKGWNGDSRWLNYGIKYGDYINTKLLPKTTELLQEMERVLEIEFSFAGFSLLRGQTEIPPHQDYHILSEKPKVFHYGLKVPDDCYLIINNHKIPHKEKNMVLFDDAYIHSAHNNSNENRFILYLKLK